jgi:hypothetical protein
MTIIAAPLGMIAFLNLVASSCCAALPAGPPHCHGGREVPSKPPEQSAGCHAALGCAEHRKIRNIP